MGVDTIYGPCFKLYCFYILIVYYFGIVVYDPHVYLRKSSIVMGLYWFTVKMSMSLCLTNGSLYGKIVATLFVWWSEHFFAQYGRFITASFTKLLLLMQGYVSYRERSVSIGPSLNTNVSKLVR